MYDGTKSEKALISVVGLGEFGTCVVRDLKERFEFMQKRSELDYKCSFYFVNETCEMLAVECGNEPTIKAGAVRSIMILVGNPREINYRILHSAVITMFGSPEGIRVAFLEEAEDKWVKRNGAEFQLDQVFGCTESNAPGMIRNFILRLSDNAFMEELLNGEVLAVSREDFCSLEGYDGHLGSLVGRTCEDIVRKIDPLRTYRARILVDVLPGSDCVRSVVNKFTEELKKHLPWHKGIIWEETTVTTPYEYCEYLCADMTIFLCSEA